MLLMEVKIPHLVLQQLLAVTVNIRPAFTEEILNVQASDVHLLYVERRCKSWPLVAFVTDIIT